MVISTLGNHSGLRRMLDRVEVQDAEPGSFEVLVVATVADSDPGAVDGQSALAHTPFAT